MLDSLSKDEVCLSFRVLSFPLTIKKSFNENNPLANSRADWNRYVFDGGQRASFDRDKQFTTCTGLMILS